MNTFVWTARTKFLCYHKLKARCTTFDHSRDIGFPPRAFSFELNPIENSRRQGRDGRFASQVGVSKASFLSHSRSAGRKFALEAEGGRYPQFQTHGMPRVLWCVQALQASFPTKLVVGILAGRALQYWRKVSEAKKRTKERWLNCWIGSVSKSW